METIDLEQDDTVNISDVEHEEKFSGVKFHLKEFSGPLDLLLFLVKQHKIDIYDIPIAEITEQYITYLNELVELDLDNLTDFYKMASWLLLIKSRQLLPVHIEYDDEDMDATRTELINTLIEYQRYKKLSELLHERYTQFNWLTIRQETATIPFIESEMLQWKEMDSLELFIVFMKIMDKPEQSQRLIDLNEATNINEKITLIFEKLDSFDECSFDEIVAGGGVISVVCSLLALLELMKQQKVRALQDKINGEIKIVKGKLM